MTKSGAFQTVAFALGSGLSESVNWPFKRCFSVCYSPLGLVEVIAVLFSKSDIFGAHFSGARVKNWDA